MSGKKNFRLPPDFSAYMMDDGITVVAPCSATDEVIDEVQEHLRSLMYEEFRDRVKVVRDAG